MNDVLAKLMPRNVAGMRLSLSRYMEPLPGVEVNDENAKYELAEEFATRIGDIQAPDRFFGIVDGKFIFGDLIEALVVNNNWHVEELTISTLGMSEANIDSLATLLQEDRVETLNLCLSEYYYSHERRGLIPYMYQELDIDNRFQVSVAGTHTKMVLMRLDDGRKITMHGSANLRSSGNVEHVMVEADARLYDFAYDTHRRILDEFKLINKAIRGKQLWGAITRNETTNREKAGANLQPQKATPLRNAAGKKRHP